MTAFVRLGVVNAFLAVALGAFGAHGLRDRITPDMLAVYQTGVQYHQFHALALLFVGLLIDRLAERGALLAQRAGALFTIGIVLFGGSLYGLALTGIRKLGIITPLGGVCFLLGWVTLALAVSHRREP